MRVVVQRVLKAGVDIEGVRRGEIQAGLLVFVGIEEADAKEDIEWMAGKIVNLRVFNDENKVPNLSVKDTGHEILIVSQFTLHASTRKGNRPSYIRAANPAIAIPVYNEFISALVEKLGRKIHTGEFGADMKISLVNDGPVTIWMDSKNKE